MIMKNEFSNTECVLDAFDSALITFDELEMIRGMKHDILTRPDEVVKDFDKMITKFENTLFDWEICPVCGGSLVFEHDSSRDTVVPFGNYSTIETEGGDMVCTSCGFRREYEQ